MLGGVSDSFIVLTAAPSGIVKFIDDYNILGELQSAMAGELNVWIATVVGLFLGALASYVFCRREAARQQQDLAHQLQQEYQQQSHEQALQLQALQQNQENMQSAAEQAQGQQQQLQQQLQQLQQRAETAETAMAVDSEKLSQLDGLKAELAAKTEQASALQLQSTELQTRLEQEQKRFVEQQQLIAQAKQEMGREFEGLAHKIFDAKQQQFSQQFSQQSKQTLEGSIDPLRTQLKEFRQRVEDVYDKENAERNKLVGQITELQKQTQQIGQDAVNLATALKGDNKAQGNWGEVILERLLEQSGLQKGREYDTQVALKNEEGQRRNPDVIIRLPENKDIVIDSKVSLNGYERYCSSDDESERQAALKQHITSLRTHIADLSIKDYERLDGIRSLDFVFIFVPIEAAFMLALQQEPALFREAYDKHIILVSPTTLLATLRTVENIWRYEKQNKNAEKIATQAGGLYDQFVLLLDSLGEIGRHLQKTQDAYETTEKRLKTGRGNLVKRVDDLKKLGAKTKKSLDVNLLEEASTPSLEAELPKETAGSITAKERLES